MDDLPSEPLACPEGQDRCRDPHPRAAARVRRDAAGAGRAGTWLARARATSRSSRPIGRPARPLHHPRPTRAQQRLLASVLVRLEQANPTGAIAVITDSLSSHSSLATRAWLAGHRRIEQVFIPKGACWLQPAGGLVTHLPPARPGRADLRRLERDRYRHRGGHRPAQRPCQTVGLGTATATPTAPPTPLYLLAL